MLNIKLILYFCAYGSGALAFGNDTLKSISVIFRHGDRTPEPFPKGFYPKDPYRNCSFEPIGQGGLTNAGKRREYQIGLSLRARYNDFLGDYYKESELSVTSTDFERTKMSLLLVLNGLYPPKGEQIWKTDIDWQPIPIKSVPDELRSFMNPLSCPIFANELDKVKNSETYKNEVSQFDQLRAELTELTGKNMKSTFEIYHLYHTLTAESEMNLKLPEWTTDYFPHRLINATLFEYKTQSYNELLKKLNGGLFIRKILNDLSLDANVVEAEKNPKVHLYSCHEDNIAATMYALNIWKNIIPEYSCAIIFELHEKDSKLYLRILYYKGKPAEFETRIIPECSEYCPIEKFIKIEKNVTPDNIVNTCFGPASDSQLIPKNVDPNIWIYEKIREWFKL